MDSSADEFCHPLSTRICNTEEWSREWIMGKFRLAGINASFTYSIYSCIKAWHGFKNTRRLEENSTSWFSRQPSFLSVYTSHANWLLPDIGGSFLLFSKIGLAAYFLLNSVFQYYLELQLPPRQIFRSFSPEKSARSFLRNRSASVRFQKKR